MTQKPVIACLPSRKKATHRQAGVATNHRIKQSKLPACRQAGATTKKDKVSRCYLFRRDVGGDNCSFRACSEKGKASFATTKLVAGKKIAINFCFNRL